MDQLTEIITKAAARTAALGESRGAAFDYTEKSLPLIDGMLDETVRWVSALPPEQLTTLVQDVGCYILEVGRREFGGRFEWRPDKNQPALVVGEPGCKIGMVTWDKVRGRLAGDVGDNIPFFYAGFAAKAREAPPDVELLFV